MTPAIRTFWIACIYRAYKRERSYGMWRLAKVLNDARRRMGKPVRVRFV